MLEAQGNLLEYIVDNHNDKILMITVEGSNQDSKKVNIAVLHFPWIGKNLLHNADNLIRSEKKDFIWADPKSSRPVPPSGVYE